MKIPEPAGTIVYYQWIPLGEKSKKLASIGDDLYNPMAVNLKTFAYAMVS